MPRNSSPQVTSTSAMLRVHVVSALHGLLKLCIDQAPSVRCLCPLAQSVSEPQPRALHESPMLVGAGNCAVATVIQPSPDSLPSPSHCPVLTSVLKAVSIPITRKVQDHSNGVLFWLVSIVSYLVPYINHKDLLFLDSVFYS
jgi:hypothetical protein